jgi:hypothetical protein
MSAREIDRLVLRYLDGAMSPAEEEEFFVRMALDGELRHSYQAQRIVESALRKQRESAPRAELSDRDRFLTSIAATAAPHVAGSRNDATQENVSREPHSSAAASSATPHAPAARGVLTRLGRDLLVAGATLTVGATIWWQITSVDHPTTLVNRGDTVVAAPHGNANGIAMPEDTLRPNVPLPVPTGDVITEPKRLDSIAPAVEPHATTMTMQPKEASSTSPIDSVSMTVEPSTTQPAADAARAASDTSQRSAAVEQATQDSLQLNLRVRMP